MENKKPRGGYLTHKNPACKCPGCTARRRKTQALAITTGAGGDGMGTILADKESKEIIYADLPKEENLPNPGGRSNGRYRVLQYLNYKHEDPKLTQLAIAEKMGIARSTLCTHLHKATKEGWLKWDDPISRMDHEIIPKVIDNLSMFLDQKDKTTTIEVAKGTIFKSYQESKGISDAPQTVLALKIETADPDTPVRIITGNIVGKPKSIEGEVI